MPTPVEIQFAWWREAVHGAGKIVAVGIEPQCGFFKRKLVHGGLFVPARIFLEQEIDPDTGELLADEVMRCEVNGQARDPIDQWPRLWNNVITEEEFNYMTAARQWAAWHAPDDPAANPQRRLDPLTTPIRF